MKMTKKIMSVVLALAMILSLAMLAGCNKEETPTTGGFKVTFMVEGKQYGDIQTVQKGRRITEPAAPVFSDKSYVFTGWYTDVEFKSPWNFTTGIVNADMTLYAGYRVVSAAVTDVAKADEPCTSKIVWSQSVASAADKYEVIITDANGNATTLTGTVEFDATNYLVTFTPAQIPQGGKYTISVKDTTTDAQAAVASDVLLGGAGTEANPYLIGSARDFDLVNKSNVAAGTYFEMVASITIETSRTEQTGFEFNGTLIGNGRTITLENSNCGAIYKVGQQGYVHNVGIAGAISTALYDSIGSIADFNAGRIEKINTTANVESTAGLCGSNGLANALNDTLPDGEGKRGIAGGVVGTNLSTGTVVDCKITTTSSSTGTIKASIGGGTIVGLNYGTIELCVSHGCFGAWNSTESGGKSLSNYSYGGGIAGINAGTVRQCMVSGSAKLLSQRYENDADGDAASGTNNSNFGGIVGYNMANATVSECSFAGIRVHADENVGGIVGLNAGSVADCYVEGAYQSTKILTYIGGRKNVGGIVGKLEATGSVSGCFVTANVYGFNAGTAYSVAEKANNCVYLSANPNAKSLEKNPDSVALTAPTGTGNVTVEVVANSYDGQTVNFALAESYLSNLSDKFSFDGTTIKHAYESNLAPEASIEVTIVADGAESTVTVYETGAAISAPIKTGFKFVGWAVVADGEIVFEASDAISMYDLQDYADANGVIRLYAVYEERVANEGLIVGIWDRYVNAEKVGADTAEKIEAAFRAYMSENNLTFNVEFRVYTESAVADFGAAVNAAGDVDVILGAGANIQSAGGVAYIARAYMTYEGLTSRYAVLLTDTEFALTFYAYITGLTNDQADVTFVVDGQPTTVTVNNLLGIKADAPALTLEEGFELLGWATTESAAEAQFTGTSFSYADVKDYLTNGTVTLYPVIAKKLVEDTTLKVSVWTKDGGWVTAAELEAIKAGFENYLTGLGYDLSKLTITYVETVTEGNKVADLGAAVIAAGDFDIIIGCGNNVDSSGGVTVISKGDILTGHVAAGRKVATLTSNTLAGHLYTYLSTVEPAPAPEEPPVEEPVADTTLKVSVWAKGGSWVTEAELAAIKTGFEAYLTNKGYDISKLTITYVVTDTSAVADLGAEVNTAGDFDIIIGCGSNVTTKGGVETKEKADILATFVAASRMAARLTDNTLAQELYAYLTTQA